MRIVAGAWRGRRLVAPPGQGTRPTADRVRQALFDTLMHAEWGGRGLLEAATVLDVFAGTGALGLEALSRGATRASFIESDQAALRALRANIAACRAEGRTEVVAIDALKLGVKTTAPANLVFLDPPYGLNLVARVLARLQATGYVSPAALVVAEIGRDEPRPTDQPLLQDRQYGAARILMFRAA
jgi:16S rRNA (guanine966-N2)-methyltransferase